MSPALKVGEIVIATDLTKTTPIQRFEIVVFRMPEEVKKLSGDKGDTKIISRIIGLPGEKIEIKKGRTFINDLLLEEGFEKIPDEKKYLSPIVVPENEYFLLGDNRPESLDSRYWKKPTINRSEISGKIAED